jgi:thiamine biosynthesis lipoprotein
MLDIDINQTIYGDNAPQTARQVLKQITKLQKQISWKEDGSQVQKINKNAGHEWVDLSSGVIDILSKSLDVANSSNGTFDPTILPISAEQKTIDSQKESENHSPVNYKDLKLNKDVKRAKLFNENARLDLRSIFEGAACNFAIEEYMKQNQKAIISVGHSIGIYGTKKDEPWRIDIPVLKDPNKTRLGILETKESHIFISGSYENELDPQIDDKKTNDLVCVLITHTDGVISDALSNACILLDLEKSKTLIELYQAGAIFVDKNKHVFVSDNIKNQLRITNKQFSLC